MNAAAADLLKAASSLVAKGNEYHRQAAEKIVAAQRKDSTITHAQIAERVGMSKSWVSAIVQTVASGQPLSDDFKVQWGREKPATTSRKALRDPKQRQEVLADLTPDELVEVARDAIAADPTVQETVDADALERQAERKFERDQRRLKASAGTPLSAYFHRLIGALKKTARDLDWIRGELHTLADGEKPSVDEALVEVIASAEAARLELYPDRKPTGIDEGIVEGTARDAAA